MAAGSRYNPSKSTMPSRAEGKGGTVGIFNSSMAPMLEDVLHRRPYNAVTDFVDANVARGLGGKIAFTDSERSLTYAELQERSCRFAAALRTLSLREENRVILLFHDTVDHPVAFWGTIRAGIIPIPVN